MDAYVNLDEKEAEKNAWEKHESKAWDVCRMFIFSYINMCLKGGPVMLKRQMASHNTKIIIPQRLFREKLEYKHSLNLISPCNSKMLHIINNIFYEMVYYIAIFIFLYFIKLPFKHKNVYDTKIPHISIIVKLHAKCLELWCVTSL